MRPFHALNNPSKRPIYQIWAAQLFSFFAEYEISGPGCILKHYYMYIYLAEAASNQGKLSIEPM